MAAEKGNQYWRIRSDMSEDGRKISIEDLKIKCEEYINRCANSTIKEQVIQKIKTSRDTEEIKKVDCDKMILMSVWGVCSYIGISSFTWYEMRKDKKYSKIITRVEDIFKAYNAEGVGAGQLNQNIVTRIDGHVDKTENTVKTEQPLFPDVSKNDSNK